MGSLGLIHNEDYVGISSYSILNNFIPLTLGYKGYAESWSGSPSIRSSEHLEEVINKYGQRNIWIVFSGQKLKDYESRRELVKIMSVMKSFRMERQYLVRDELSNVYLMSRGTGRHHPERV